MTCLTQCARPNISTFAHQPTHSIEHTPNSPTTVAPHNTRSRPQPLPSNGCCSSHCSWYTTMLQPASAAQELLPATRTNATAATAAAKQTSTSAHRTALQGLWCAIVSFNRVDDPAEPDICIGPHCWHKIKRSDLLTSVFCPLMQATTPHTAQATQQQAHSVCLQPAAVCSACSPTPSTRRWRVSGNDSVRRRPPRPACPAVQRWHPDTVLCSSCPAAGWHTAAVVAHTGRKPHGVNDAGVAFVLCVRVECRKEGVVWECAAMLTTKIPFSLPAPLLCRSNPAFPLSVYPIRRWRWSSQTPLPPSACHPLK